MPERELLVGHSYATLRDEAFALADTLAGDGFGRIVWVEETEYQHERLADAWSHSYHPLKLRLSSLDSLADDIHEGLFGPTPEPGTQLRRRVIERSLTRAGESADIEEPRQYADLFSELFLAMEREGMFTAEELLEAQVPYASLLNDAYEHYHDLQRLLVHPQVMTRPAKMDAVANDDGAIATILEPIEVIVISGVTDLGSVEWSFLDRLCEAFHVIFVIPQTNPDPLEQGVNRVTHELYQGLLDRGFERTLLTPESASPTLETVDAMYRSTDGKRPTGTITWHEAPTPDRTVRHVARRVRSRLASGTDPSDILVVAPGLLSYREYIADAFDTYEIDTAVHLSVFLEHTYLGRAIKDAVALCEFASASRVVDLVTNPLVTVPELDPAAVAAVQRRLYTDDVWRLVGQVDDEHPGLLELLEQVRHVREANPADFMDALSALLRTIGIDLDGELGGHLDDPSFAYERTAIQQVRIVFESIEAVIDASMTDDPLGDVREALDIRISPGLQEVSGRVAVVGLEDTPMADVEYVYVLAPTADTLPGSQHRPRFFRQLADELGVLPPEHDRDRARYQFGLLLANARHTHLATPARTMDDDQILVSPMVDELTRVADIDATSGVGEEPIAAFEDLQRMQARTSATVERRIAAVEGDDTFSTQQARHTISGIRCASNRSVATFSAHDGQLPSHTLHAVDSGSMQPPFSPNRLSAYSRCGFKFLLDYGLEFDEPEDIEPGTDPREVGLLIHHVLQRFIERLQTAPGERVILAQFERETLEALLIEVTLDAIAENVFDVRTLFDERLLGILLEGLGDRDGNPYYDHFETGDAVDRGVFARFLDVELTEDQDRQPALVEHVFDGLVVASPGHTDDIELRGMIDRVDIDASGRHATVYDYKTSSRSRLRNTEMHAVAGLDFQLPIYELAGLDIDAIESVKSRYYQVRPSTPSVERLDDIGETLEEAGIDRETFLETVTPRRLDAVISAIEAGAFQPTLLAPEEAGCTYCGYRDVCDVRHHRRHELRDTIVDGTATQYLPDVALGATHAQVLAQVARWVEGDLDE